MKTYFYHFNDGTIKTIKVNDDLYTILREQDKLEKQKQWIVEKHNTSLDYLKDEGIEFGDDTENPCLLLLKQEDEQAFEDKLLCLRPKQRELLDMFLFDGKTVTQIAEELGLAHSTISERLATIFRKLKNLF